MRIAVIMGQSSSGGISRFQRAMIEHLIDKHDDIEIDIYAGDMVIERDELSQLEKHQGLTVYSLESFGVAPFPGDKAADAKQSDKNKVSILRLLKKVKTLKKLVALFKKTILREKPYIYQLELSEEVKSRLENYDLLYFASIYFLQPIHTKVPIVTTFYDFNWKHTEFKANRDSYYMNFIDNQISDWLRIVQRFVAISYYTGDEFKLFYPEYSHKVNVVRLSFDNLLETKLEGSSAANINNIMKRYKLDKGNYLFYPSRVAEHKNILKLIEAVDILKKKGQKNIQLVLTGPGTELLMDTKTELNDVEQKRIRKFLDKSSLEIGVNIVGLGYINDETLSVVMKNAKMLVSPSLYEGFGLTPLESLYMGVATVMSDIPAHQEHISKLGVRALTFDPNSVESLVRAIQKVLSNPTKYQQMAKESKEAIDKYTWNDVAQGYYNVFTEAIKK